MDDPSDGRVSADASQHTFLWTPSPRDIAGSHVYRFMQEHGIPTLAAFQERSVSDIGWYWDAVVRHLDLQFYSPYTQTLDLSAGIAWPSWFPASSYNYVHNALDRPARGAHSARVALIEEREDGRCRQMTYAELLVTTDRMAWALQRVGIGRGDRVGLFMPMCLEAVVAMFALAKLAAIFTPIFSGYGEAAVASRLNDCTARMLITSEGFQRRGKRVPQLATALSAAEHVPTLQHVVVVQDETQLPLPDHPLVRQWHHLLSTSPVMPFPTRKTAADEPYMLIYTSGTTGKPKGTVHVHAGFPIKAAHDQAMCFDISERDTLLWHSDLGWMMGPWAIAGGLTLGATVVLYDGAPDYPEPDRLWALAERYRVTVLGVSPTLVRVLSKRGDHWPNAHDLSRLRAFGSSGEPWNHDPWLWLFNVAGKARLPVINYAGGTEVSGGILSSSTLLPQTPCSFAGPVPGMDAAVVDERGQDILGAVGELVMRQPWVGMTHGFWQDRHRYEETYWTDIPGVWRHGDWARIDEAGQWHIVGRSDDTIKVAGRRVGPAEIETVAVEHADVAEAAAIGAPDDLKGEELVLLIVPRSFQEPTGHLPQEIAQLLRRRLGATLVPSIVLVVTELPRTRSNKVMRRVARAAFLGSDTLGDLSSLENPAAIDGIRQAAAAAGTSVPTTQLG